MNLKKIPFGGLVVASLVMNLIVVIVFFGIRSFLPPVVPLLYGRPSGEGQLVTNIWLLTAPVLSVFLTLINVFFANSLTDAFAKKLLTTAAFLLSLLTTITFLKIVFLVGFF